MKKCWVFGAMGAAALAFAAPASAVSKNVRALDQLEEAKWATAINFLEYQRPHRRKGTRDVMLVTGRFGLKSYSLADPRHPKLLDEITSDDLRLPGDPPTDFTVSEAGGDPPSTFWQNEDMDVDKRRKLVLISRDPRSYAGSTSRDPGTPDPNNATNIAGVYVVDAKKPGRLRLLTFKQLPTGHTTTCINGCRWLWTGGPASTDGQKANLGWTFGRPIIVTDLRNPRRPRSFPLRPVDLLRRDGVTAYSHDVQVDPRGIAWVSGDGGTRGYWTKGRHRDPLTGDRRRATPLDPVPYGGGGLPASAVQDTDGGFEHNAWRPIGRSAPRSDPRYRRGRLLLITEEDFFDPDKYCQDRGKFSIASLAGSFDGEAWRSTAQQPFRLNVVGTWSPFQQEGSRPLGQYAPGAQFCSAHYFDVHGATVSYAWYGEGTRFLDISDPANPRQIAYWRPDDTLVWAAYQHKGYVYTADHVRGVDVLRLTRGARRARRSGRDLVAPVRTARQSRFLAAQTTKFRADPATGGLCLLIQ